MLISHDLLKTQKTRKQHLRVTVELYDYGTELYNELSRIGIIEQLSNVPQLGAIRVEHKLEKSRYDYVILQLYLHQLVQENLGKNLKFTYGSGIKLHEFGADESRLRGIGEISVADIVQVLTLAYNIGHFYNTFVSSRAVIMMSNVNGNFRQLLYNGSTDERFSQILETYLADKNYLRFHLLNSLLVLDKCNPNLYSVKLAREILYAYINEDALEQNNKLKYAFSLFRSVRSVAYIAYDLQVAKVSFTIDALYGDIQKEEQDLKDAHKKANRHKTLMEQELKKLKGEKMRMYEEYAAGTLLLDTYKQKKQECDRRISEVQEQIEQSKAEESTQSLVPGTVRAAAEQAENFLNGTRLTASMVSAFVENVFVYGGGRIVVRFKYEQSIQDATRALHKS